MTAADARVAEAPSSSALTGRAARAHSPFMEQDIETLSFEAGLRELEQIVAKLESGETPLEEAIRLYERGSVLRQRCADRLDAAQARIEAIRLGADGKPAGTEPFAAG